uniref:uncharacterized protein isoform X2 n=1 Tax=Pristiophorus japonicus TaxID=55135 RepID=UPI00398E7B56
MKHRLWASHSSGHAPNTEDKSELKSFIQRKVTKLLNLDGNDLETRGKLQKLMKYGKSQRDRVDIILLPIAFCCKNPQEYQRQLSIILLWCKRNGN